MTIFFQVDFATSHTEKEEADRDANQNAQAQPIIVSHEGKHQKVADGELNHVQNGLNYVIKACQFPFKLIKIKSLKK